MIKFPPQKILVAYDLSDVSLAAWRHAAALAAKHGAEVELVYVEPWQMGADLMPAPDLSAARVRAIRAKIRATAGDGPRITILQGDPAARLLHVARLHRPDMIVVGTHGRKGLTRALLGSVAEAVVRGAQVPVLVARGPVHPVRAILAPVNFTAYSEYGFSCAAAVAAVMSADLTALHVTDDPIWNGNSRFRLSSLIHRLPPEIVKRCRPTARELVGEAVKGILKARAGHDWIVLVAHMKSPVKDALFGTTLEQVLRRSAIPVLAVPAKAGSLFALRVESVASAAPSKSMGRK